MNKNIKLALILGLLILAVYIYQGPFSDWQDNKDKVKNDFENINIDAIERIEVRVDKEDHAIIKEKDKWKIENTKDFYLSDNVSESLKTKFEEAKKATLELVSNNKDKKADFIIGDDLGLKIKVAYANSFMEFNIGKYTNEGGNYINFSSRPDEVYSANIDFISVFSDPLSWYDKTIFNAKKEDINHLRFQYPGSEFSIDKNDKGKWVGIKPYNFNVNEAKLEKILDIMASLTSVKIPEQTFKDTGLEKGLMIVQATGGDMDNTLMVGDKDKEGNYYAKKGSSDNIYLITKEQRDELAKKINDFR